MNRILISALLLCCIGVSSAQPIRSVKAELFWEPLDPRGWQVFVVMDSVKRRMGSKMDLRIVPVISKDKNGAWQASQGEEALGEAKRIALLQKNYADKFLTYMSARGYGESWKNAAAFAGISPESLERLVASKGASALEESYAAAQAVKVTSLSLLVDGAPYGGDWGLLPVLANFNERLPKDKRLVVPSETKKTPAISAKGWAVVASTAAGLGGPDKNLSAGLARVLQDAAVLNLQTVSYDDALKIPELSGAGISFLPYYAIESSTPVETALKRYIEGKMLVKEGSLIAVAPGERDGIFLKRAVVPNTLELFVMAQCPYGVLAEKSVSEALDKKLLPEGLSLKVHYIADVSTGKNGEKVFNSLHGSPEWEEDIRQLIIQQYFPDKFWKYLSLRNEDPASSLWENVASSAGLDPKDIAGRFEDGKQLLEADIKFAQEIGANSSPAFLLEGNKFLLGMESLRKMPGFEKLPVIDPAAAKGSCK